MSEQNSLSKELVHPHTLVLAISLLILVVLVKDTYISVIRPAVPIAVL